MSPPAVREREEEDLVATRDPDRNQSTKKRWVRWVMFFVVLGIVVFMIQRYIAQKHSETAAQAARSTQQSIPVTVAAAKTGDIPVYLNGLGSVTAFNTVTVKTRVDGQLIQLPFREGSMVHKGETLAEIDPRPFQVQLEQAQGQLSKDQAQLNNAKIDLDRYQLLLKQDAIPQQQLATQQATVQQLEGTIKSDEAAIDSAKLQLVYCHVTAPISGRIGLRLVDVGNMVHVSDTSGLVVITQIQPISVLFTLPEDSLPSVFNQLHEGKTLSVDAYDRSGTNKIATGSLSTVDNQIDPNTGTLRLKAVFENQDNSLFPNQFVNIKLLTEVKKHVVMIPLVAIQRGPQGTFAFVVKQDGKVEIRTFVVGTISGNDASIDRGLSSGETVVVEGMDKLREGSSVRTAGAKSGSSRRPVK